MKSLLKSTMYLLIVAVLSACSSDDESTPIRGSEVKTSTPVDAGGKYTEQTVSIRRNGQMAGTTTLRFFEATADIPYISVANFHRVMLPNATMSVTRQGDLYTITNTGGSATVDVKGDKLTTTTYLSLFGLSSLTEGAIPNASYDGSLYLKPLALTYDPTTTTVTLDFKKYEIDLHDDGSNVYIPYATLADIYSDMNLNVSYYNAEDKVLEVSIKEEDMNYDKYDTKRVQRVYGRQEVSEAFAKYRYNELCFVFDYIYGYPGHDNEITRAGIESKGFDAALEDAKHGKEVKKLLKSTNNLSFVLGMDGLTALAFDGGHTSTTQQSSLFKQPELYADYASLLVSNAVISELVTDYNNLLTQKLTYKSRMEKLRQAAYGDKKYIVSSDKSTAVIVLDSFLEIDYEGWANYYASSKTAADWATLLARKGNMMATFLSGVEQARKDGAKTIILDLTQNGGGSSDMAMTMLSLTTKNPAEREKVTLYNDCVLTRQKASCSFVVDRNFDGKFDAADALVDNSDLNFAVLTSAYSFSCGNFMPSIMKDSGHKVMGERSGGGSCAIQVQFTPDGMNYFISCYRLRLRNAKGENIDVGVPVDINVPTEKFYDIDYLANAYKNQ